MKSIQYKVRGVEHTVEVPESADEYDKLAGRVGASVDDSNRYTLAHKWAGQVRGETADRVEKESGEKRKTKPGPLKADGSAGEEVYAESDNAYIERIIAEGHVSKEDVDQWQTEVAQATPFNPGATEREGRIKKEFYTKADQIIAAIASGSPKFPKGGKPFVDNVVSYFESNNPGTTIERADDAAGTPDRDSLAAAIKADDERTSKAKMAELGV